MRSLRALRDRGGTWGLLVVVVIVAVAAAVLAAGSSAGDARSGTFAPLLLLTAVLVAIPATELARHRRAEVSLVRVRGGHGVRLVGSVIGEALVAVVVGALVGLVLGGVLLRVLHERWGVEALIGGDELSLAAATAVAAAVPAVGSAVVVAREPLTVALRRTGWTGPGARLGFVGLVLGVAAVLAAAVAVYRARTDSPGSLVLAGPVLVGLAAGQLVVWVHRALARRAGLASGSGLGVLLGVRRALSVDHGPALRALVAVGTVVAAATCAVSATDAWAEDSARIGNGGPLRIEMPGLAALPTLLLTEELDPDGRWLMAAAVADERDQAVKRLAWLDLSRYERVLGDHLAGTPADLSERVTALRDAPAVQLVSGDEITVQVARPAEITVHYLDDDGTISLVSATGSVPVDDCLASCVLIGVASSVDTDLTVLRLGDTDLIAEPLSLVAGELARPDGGTAPEPMVLAGSIGPADTSVDGIGGEPRRLEVVGGTDALPLLSGAGLLGDLRVGLAASGGSVPAVDSVVLARDDTPQAVLDGLAAAGAETPRDWLPADRTLSDRELAETRIARVTAAAASVLGLLVVLAGRRRRGAALDRERAALRLLGVRAGAGRTSHLVETLLLAVVVAGTTLAAGWVSAAVVAEGMGLVRPGPLDLPFGEVLSWTWLVAVSLGAGLAQALGVLVTARRSRRRSSPATLAAGERG